MRTRRKIQKLAESDHRPLTPISRTNKSRVTNGKAILPGVDGRSALTRRIRDIATALVTDAGGLDRCSEVRVALIKRFAAACVLAETLEAKLANGEEIDIGEHALLSSTLVRLSTRIGLNRRSKSITPDLDAYLDAKHRGDGDDDDDGDVIDGHAEAAE